MTNYESDRVHKSDRPDYNRKAFWSPAFALAVGGGAVLWLLADAWGSWGYAAVLGVPFVIGCFLGYGLRVRKLVLILLVAVVAGGLVGGAVTAEIAGLLCGLILLAILVGPALLGLAVGVILRNRLRKTDFSQRDYLPIILLFLATGGIIYMESAFVGRSPEETVRTSRILPFDARQVWDSLVFYEEVRHEPPLLARIGLPHPLYTSGEILGVGDITRCVYNKGWLVKRITEYQLTELLSFDVVEQHGIEDRSVRLVSGSFEFERVGPGQTRVTLTTVYEPLLSARPVWRPFEIQIARSLHDHVLTGIEFEARRTDQMLLARSAP